MEIWKILDTGKQSAEENMRLDVELLEKADLFPRPILHLYEWSGDCATHGHFTDPYQFLNGENAKRLELNLAKRPTGGGIVFHIWDMAFSVLVPSHCPEFSTHTLQNYAFINNAVLSAIKEFLGPSLSLSLTSDDFFPLDSDCLHFCMAKPTLYDLMWEGKKVAGAAQRKTKKGFLHQGTIALVMPPRKYLEQVLLAGTRVKEAMLAHTCPLLGKSASQSQMSAAKQRLAALLATHLTDASLSLSHDEQ
jgi:lipoate-protein ligase A